MESQRAHFERGPISTLTDNMSAIDHLVFLPDSMPYGLSLQGWTKKWWRWLLGMPKSANPALDTSGEHCAKNQMDQNVWFLAGTMGGAARRRCNIPEGRAILLPIIIDEQSFSERTDLKSDSELVSLARSEVDKVLEMNARVDYYHLSNPRKYRVESGPFDVMLPEDNICGVKAGPTRAAADGYWFFLKPLSFGKHTAHIFGRGPHFETEVTYDLTIGKIEIDE